MYYLALLLYAIGLIFYAAYSFLLWLSKPGMRKLVPGIMVAAMFIPMVREPIVSFNRALISGAIGGYGLLVIELLVFGFGFVLISRFLGLVLGIFPGIGTPLLPQRRPKAVVETNRAPAPVRIVVPPLPR